MDEPKTLPLSCGLQTARTTNGPADATPQDIRELLTYVKLAVEDIREQLKAKHKPHYTVEEMAGLVGRSPYTVRRWIAEGRIKAIRVEGTGPKGRLLIARDQLNVLIAGGLAAAVPDAVVGT